jgi:hypothetical protein
MKKVLSTYNLEAHLYQLFFLLDDECSSYINLQSKSDMGPFDMKLDYANVHAPE